MSWDTRKDEEIEQRACTFVNESKYDMPSMVPHTSSTSGMLSDLIVNRFQYAITSGREMYRMVNEKMRMSKSTIFNWLRHGAEITGLLYSDLRSRSRLLLF